MMISPQSIREIFGNGGVAAEVTPCTASGTRASMERELMAQCIMRRDAAEKYNKKLRGSGGACGVSPIERKEVSRAVYGILRDNLPQALENSTTHEELTLIAESIESKLYQTASSPRTYCAFSTLELRITALATAVLIHSDKSSSSSNNGIQKQGISDTCARLSAAARKSLVYCVMVLVSYEKRDLDKQADSFLVQNHSKRQQQQRQDRMTKGGYSQEQREAAEYYLSLMKNQSNHECSATVNQHFESVGKIAGSDNNAVNGQIVLDRSKQVQLFPPTA